MFLFLHRGFDGSQLDSCFLFQHSEKRFSSVKLLESKTIQRHGGQWCKMWSLYSFVLNGLILLEQRQGERGTILPLSSECWLVLDEKIQPKKTVQEFSEFRHHSRQMKNTIEYKHQKLHPSFLKEIFLLQKFILMLRRHENFRQYLLDILYFKISTFFKKLFWISSWLIHQQIECAGLWRLSKMEIFLKGKWTSKRPWDTQKLTTW